MNSCLYRCQIMHDRKKPKRHRFGYSCFLFCIDLDEVSLLDGQLQGFSYNRPNLYSLNVRDHLDEGGQSIRENLTRFLGRSGIRATVGTIRLVTNLRVFGYVFNPVSFYFVERVDGTPECVVAEVGNTFGEQKLYLIRQRDGDPQRFRQTLPKRFYVSPFSELDTEFHFDLQRPDERLDLRISESDAEGEFFRSALTGKRVPLTNRNLLAATLRFPAMTAKVIAAIHWQAAKLAYAKRLPFHRKAENPHLQTDVRPIRNKPTAPIFHH